MQPEKLIAFDLETHLIQPGLLAPPVVCGSMADTKGGQLLSASEAASTFLYICRSDRVLVGANIAFDVICMLMHFARQGIDISADVLKMYDENRVYDILIAEQLHAIAKATLGLDPFTFRKITDPETKRPGRYSLREVVKQVLGRDNAKANDRFRMSYALLENTPIDQWPIEARTYPIDDATNTLEVALAQLGHALNVGPHLDVKINQYPWTGCKHCGFGYSPTRDPACTSTYRRENLHDVARQTYTDFCMKLGAAWGFQVDQAAVDALEAKYLAEHDGKLQPFIDAGIVREDGTEDQIVLKKLVVRAYGCKDPCTTCQGTGKIPSPKTAGKTKINCTGCGGTGLELTAAVPRTEKDGIGKGRDALRESDDPFLISYADESEGSKLPRTYIPYLRGTDREGRTHKGVPLTLYPNVLLETGRTSYNGVIQLMPRVGGIRECIAARPGMVFSSEDYKAGELVTHAQSCMWLIGASRLAQALNEGLDAHLAGAGTIVGIDYQEAERRLKAGDKQIKDLRQAFKPCNFGFPGRMGAGKLVLQQRKQGPDTRSPSGRIFKGLRFCILMGIAKQCGEIKVTEWKGIPYPPTCKKCLECATELKRTWLTTWPENQPYFDFVKRQDEGDAPIVQHVSKRLRGFRKGQVDNDGNPINSGNAIANGYFQGLLADAAKAALIAVTRRCLTGGDVLYGSRVILFAHDELVAEHREHLGHEGAWAISNEMVGALQRYCPDLQKACEAEPTLMRRLLKSAQKVEQNGRLVCWEPNA